MTTYPATNLQLTYDNATNQWNFTEVAYDYGATPPPSWSGYTGEDPAYEYASDVSTTPPPNTDPCPPGYIYDEALKHCVSDPNYQAPSYSGEPGDTSIGGGDKPIPSVDPENPLGIWIPPVQNSDGTWVDGHYQQMPKTMAEFSSQDLFDYGVSKGYIDADGNIIGPMQTTLPGWLGGIGQSGNERKFNNWLEFYQKKPGLVEDISGPAGMVIPGKVSVLSTPPIAPPSVLNPVEKWAEYIEVVINTLPEAPPSMLNPVVPKPPVIPKPQASPSILNPVVPKSPVIPKPQASPSILAEERKQEIHTEKVNQEREKTEQEKIKTDRERQERVEKRQEQKEAGTGGSFGREDTRPVSKPVSRPEPQKKEKKSGQGGAPIWRL